MLTFFQALPARSPLATLCQQLLPLSEAAPARQRQAHKDLEKATSSLALIQWFKSSGSCCYFINREHQQSHVYSSCILQRLIKVICWPIHKAPAAFSRTFPIFNKSLAYPVWHRDVSGHAMLKDHTDTVKWSTRKGRSAATQHWSQGNNNSEQTNHKPQGASFQKSAPPQTVPAVLHSPFWLSSTPSAQLPRRGFLLFHHLATSVISP